MKAKNYSCGLEAAMAVIEGKWKCLVLNHLAGSPRRFSELVRLVVGIREKILIQRLKEMELDGLLVRNDFHETPPRVEYALTQFGMTLANALQPLCDWGATHMERISSLPMQAAVDRPKQLVRGRQGSGSSSAATDR